MSQPAEPETNSEEQSTLPVKTEEGTILLTPEEIRAALDAGTLDASNIDTACLTDENGLLSWLWSLLAGSSFTLWLGADGEAVLEYSLEAEQAE